MYWFTFWIVVYAVCVSVAVYLLAKRLISYPKMEVIEERLSEIAEREDRVKLREVRLDQIAERLSGERQEIEAVRQENGQLKKYRHILNAKVEAERIIDEAKQAAKSLKEQANEAARTAYNKVKADAKDMHAKAQAALADAKAEAKRISADAREKAKEVEKAAHRVTLEADRYQKNAISHAEDLKAHALEIVKRAEDAATEVKTRSTFEVDNVMTQLAIHKDALDVLKASIEQTGDYITPPHASLDDIATAYGHTDYGHKLKESRVSSRQIVKAGRAAACEHPDKDGSKRASRFVVDAFNAKFDLIVARVKNEPLNKLQQELREARAVINLNASMFGNARVTDEYLDSRLDELKWASLLNDHRIREQEEQRALRQQIKEEERAKREHEQAAKEAAREEQRIREAMEKAEQEMKAREAELEARLREQIALGEEERASLLREQEAIMAEQLARMQEMEAKLREAEEKGRRELSMAQQTRMGHVYVISNRGSFGDDVYKIGMTRRLDPMDRVRELGDASVPFGFDVHALIMSNDAPALEHQLHQMFARQRVNKVNLRKEFFKTSIKEIKDTLEGLGIEASWTLASEAREYRETLRIDQMGAADPAFWEKWLNGISDDDGVSSVSSDADELEELEPA